MTVKKKITIRSEKVEYTVRKHRKAKQMKLAIYPDGNCVITLPWRTNSILADRFIREHAEWVLEKLRSMKRVRRDSWFARFSQDEYLKYKEYARELVERRIEKINEYYGFNYNRISIRNQRTRWGSCSAHGNLSFNYKLIFLPQRHLDYVIAHELCHLKEFNHSPRFWNLVAQAVPDYEKIIKDLKKA